MTPKEGEQMDLKELGIDVSNMNQIQRKRKDNYTWVINFYLFVLLLFYY